MQRSALDTELTQLLKGPHPACDGQLWQRKASLTCMQGLLEKSEAHTLLRTPVLSDRLQPWLFCVPTALQAHSKLRLALTFSVAPPLPSPPSDLPSPPLLQGTP